MHTEDDVEEQQQMTISGFGFGCYAQKDSLEITPS
jgi:hypothetical protein